LAKIAFVFPGQGAQYIGMGRDLYKEFSSFRNILNRANEILNFDITEKIFNGTEETLRDTLFTQPAVFTISFATFRVLQEKEIVPQFVAGHSLGEYTALAASGSASFDDTLKMVFKRAELIQDASRKNPGGMVAIIGLDREDVLKICKELGEEIEPANFNSPGQIVVSGTFDGCSRLEAMAREYGAKRVVRLNVSGPFHHPKLMLDARNKMAEFLEGIQLSNSEIPFISNMNGNIVRDGMEIRRLLIEQINHPVLWEDCIRRMLEEGVEIFVEVGPGKTLIGLLKRISREVQGLNVASAESLNETLEFFRVSIDK